MDHIPEPLNDHERAIAEALDSKRRASRGGSFGSIVSEVVESMTFDLCTTDIQFLFNYAHWRLAQLGEQPAKKQPAGGMLQKRLKRSG